MKIGILTFHRCINYGSYWQARCLAEALAKKGHDVSILDHRSAKVNIAEWKCALQPVLPTPVPASDHSLYKKKILKFFDAFGKLPLSRPFPLDNPSQMEDYELLIVGSDEVWNLSHPWYGYCPVFYGEGIRAKRLISYAASFGNYDAVTPIGDIWTQRLKRFERISVRDENSREIIRNATGIDPELVLDPCLQFPPGSRLGGMFQGKEKYAAVYGHNFSSFFIREVRSLAHSQNLPLVSIGYRNDWADEQWITAGPEEFLSFMGNAGSVVTNFFHGCIFALIDSKPFLCEASPYRFNKIQDLMKRIGGEKHLAGESTPLSSYELCFNEPPGENITRNVEVLRDISIRWLDQAVSYHEKPVLSI